MCGRGEGACRWWTNVENETPPYPPHRDQKEYDTLLACKPCIFSVLILT